MATQTYSIDYDGYWMDEKKGGIPEKSGIYCVYSCIYDAKGNKVTIKKLIYIGESGNVMNRIENHEKQTKWEKYLGTNEVLCYNFGPVESSNRDRCEAAMIFKHKPPVNTEYIDSFPFDQTTINLSGAIALLVSKFTVYRT